MQEDKAIEFMEKAKESMNNKNLENLLILKDFCTRKHDDSEVKEEVLSFIEICISKVETFYIDPQVEDISFIENENELDKYKVRIGRNKVNGREKIVEFYKRLVNSIIA